MLTRFEHSISIYNINAHGLIKDQIGRGASSYPPGPGSSFELNCLPVFLQGKIGAEVQEKQGRQLQNLGGKEMSKRTPQGGY